MNNWLKLFCLFFLVPCAVFAQITPREGDALNYRIIGFSFPVPQGTPDGKLQIAAGYYNDEAAFLRNIIINTDANKNKMIAEVPDFGKQYTWRIIYKDKKYNKDKSVFHHFSTMMSREVNPDSTRMRVTMAAEKYKGDYIFVDCNKTLYDMNGRPVWFFPGLTGTPADSVHLRDLKPTPFGTITTIIGEDIYEVNYKGEVLWQDPQGNIKRNDTSAHLHHHEFTRLANGNYMAMVFERALWPLPAALDSATYSFLRGKIYVDSNNIYYQKMLFGSLVEYDRQDKIVWEWDASDYFKGSDLGRRMMGNKIFNLNDTHANAFYFDEKSQTIFISFRDIDRIIQIHYPDGKVLSTYGTHYNPDIRNPHLTNSLFCGQHSCRLSSDGYVYMYNNNICHHRSFPTVLMLKQAASDDDTALHPVWEFECPMDNIDRRAQPGSMFNFGGNVLELPDSSFFVCMGGIYGKLFIVNRDKNIIWSAQPEKWDNATPGWSKEGFFIENHTREGSYRASIISRDVLESLIWGEPLKN